MINFRELYESSKELLEHNILKEIGVIMVALGKVELSKENCFNSSDGSEIIGMEVDCEGMYILRKDKPKMEISETDEDFMNFIKDPYSLICLAEAIDKETTNLV